jgi:ribose 5-phosphate isomerase B
LIPKRALKYGMECVRVVPRKRKIINIIEASTVGGIKMKVAIASDHGGINIRKEIISLFKEMNIQYIDLGCDCNTSVDYPDYAIPVAEMVANGKVDRGILICGTGIGMSITANKVKGIRCALVHDTFSAKVTREHNNSNILAIGERVIGPGLAREIARIWLTTPFEGGRHENRVNKIKMYEEINFE